MDGAVSVGSGSLYEDSASSDSGDDAENDLSDEEQAASRLQPFKRLSQLPKGSQRTIMASLQREVEDVDAWSVTVSPEYYLKNFCTAQTLIMLKANRGNKIKDNQRFAGWITLGYAGSRMSIDGKFKTPLFKELKRWRTIQESRHKGSATYGNALFAMPVLLHCLRKIECEEIRIQAYGQKLPLLPQFIIGEPAQVSHPLAELNEWDIGVTTRSTNIFLFRAPGSIPSGMTVYPMVIPRSMDFGSVNIELRYHGEDYKVKIYPCLVHVLKSFNSGLHANDPNITQTLKDRRSTIGSMIDNLAKLDPEELGGFRIEVRLKARSLKEAREKAQNLPFFDIKRWLNPTDDQMKRFKLEAVVITKEDLIRNVVQMLAIANSRDVWSGANQGKVSSFRQQVVTDLFAALGWNAGRRRPTCSHKAGAWWREPDDGGKKTAWEIILGHLTAKYSSSASLRRLFDLMKEHITNGVLPCQKNSRGVYQAYADRSRFRLRCNDLSCRHILSQFQVLEYFSQLILQGAVPYTVIGLPPNTFAYRIPTSKDPITAGRNVAIQPQGAPATEPVVCQLHISNCNLTYHFYRLFPQPLNCTM